jgi:hypothetical protein
MEDEYLHVPKMMKVESSKHLFKSYISTHYTIKQFVKHAIRR